MLYFTTNRFPVKIACSVGQVSLSQFNTSQKLKKAFLIHFRSCFVERRFECQELQVTDCVVSRSRTSTSKFLLPIRIYSFDVTQGQPWLSQGTLARS